MSITIAAVGKLPASSPVNQLIGDYLQRLPWQVTFKEVEEKRPLPPAQLKEREGELLLASLPKGALIIALDETGKSYTSEIFASHLKRWQEEHQHLAFAIGGAFGHGDILKKRATHMLSLSAMTWPHMLVRTMLAEQLYRAYTLQTGHPYHK